MRVVHVVAVAHLVRCAVCLEERVLPPEYVQPWATGHRAPRWHGPARTELVPCTAPALCPVCSEEPS